MPSKRRIKLPEMPGRIIAQMASMPLKKNTNAPLPAADSAGARPMATATPVPNKKAPICTGPRCCKGFKTRKMLARIRPLKKAHTGTGWLSSNQVISRASTAMLVKMPASKVNRNVRLACCQAATNPC